MSDEPIDSDLLFRPVYINISTLFPSYFGPCYRPLQSTLVLFPCTLTYPSEQGSSNKFNTAGKVILLKETPSFQKRCIVGRKRQMSIQGRQIQITSMNMIDISLYQGGAFPRNYNYIRKYYLYRRNKISCLRNINIYIACRRYTLCGKRYHQRRTLTGLISVLCRRDSQLCPQRCWTNK